MIDTIRFKIKIDENNIKRIKSDFTVYTKKIYIQNSEIVYKNINDKYKLGSYIDYTAIFIDNDNYLHLEFSITKYYYSHNVYLISVDMFILLIDSLQTSLEKILCCDLPPIDEWQLQRIDLCYAWKIENSQKVLDILKKYGDNKKSVWNTSIIQNRENFSIKFYLKNEEFKAHDYKKMLKVNLDNAVFLENISKDVLRYEITLRKDEIIKRKLNIYSFYDIELIYNILNEFLLKYTGMEKREFKEYKDIYYFLLNFYSKPKALRLSQFYTQWTKDIYSRNFLKSVLSKATINRNLSELRGCEVGLVAEEFINFEMAIPSELNVNNYGVQAGNTPYENELIENVALELPLPIGKW